MAEKKPKVNGESGGRYTRPTDGRGKIPLLPPVLPARAVGGTPGPNELAATRLEIVVRGASSSKPNSVSLRPRALIVAGFQYNAPRASIGAAVEAPPIDRLIGPAPVSIRPIWAAAGRDRRTAVVRA